MPAAPGDLNRILARPQASRNSLRSTRVMIIDDSLTVRSALSRMIDAQSNLEVVGKTSSAELALQDLKETQVDVVLLDLEMPGIGGLDALPKILAAQPGLQVMVVSTLTQAGAKSTLAALSMGAADTMPKPRSGEFNDEYAAALFAKIRALGTIKETQPQPVLIRTPRKDFEQIATHKPKLIAIGASTGGIHAMCLLLKNLAQDIVLPILVTQHLPDSFMKILARQLEIASGRKAIVAQNGTIIQAGHIYVAPGTGHLNIREIGSKLVVRITHESVASGCTPSVDPMLRSAAEATKGRAIGVVLSGMGRDGADGAATLRKHGGFVLVQDQESCAVWGMPGAIANDGLASAMLPPDQLGEKLNAMIGGTPWK